LSARRGDCGVQNTVFITLCRAAGVPARWQSGWETTPGAGNMHDWAEIYIPPWGWLPADASYGVQTHDDPNVQEFFCGHIDPYRLIVNLDWGQPLTPPKTSLRSEPWDFQRGEIEIDGRNLYFNEWSWNIDTQTTPVERGLATLEETCDDLVPAWLKAGKIPGAVLLVGQKTPDGFQTWSKAYGYQALEPQRETMRLDAIFDMASVSKPCATGVSLLILVDQGKVQLDDPVAKFLPEFDTPEKRAVTIRHLMTHTSGMPPYVDAASQKKLRDEYGFVCPAELRKFIREMPLTRPPGERFVYSCLNAILCAEIVDKVSGVTLDRFAAEHVFGPLHMTDSGYRPYTATDLPASQPAASRPTTAPVSSALVRHVPSTRVPHGVGPGGFLRGQVHDPLAAMQGGVSGNAGFFSTAADLSRLAQMLLNKGELDGVRILSPEIVRALSQVQNPGAVNKDGRPAPRGLLWELSVPAAGPAAPDFAFGHPGYTGTAVRIYPNQGLYAIALTNRVHPDDSGKAEEFQAAVWRTVLERLGTSETTSTASPSAASSTPH
jgi:CubicO group peptidase (beta-lactamase class C family)